MAGSNLSAGDEMSNVLKGALYWMPCGLSVAFLAFLSLFAMDVFDEHLGFWQTVLALTVHLIPVFVLSVVLLLAWRWEWIGAVVFAAAGLLYVIWVVSMARIGDGRFRLRRQWQLRCYSIKKRWL